HLQPFQFIWKGFFVAGNRRRPSVAGGLTRINRTFGRPQNPGFVFNLTGSGQRPTTGGAFYFPDGTSTSEIFSFFTRSLTAGTSADAICFQAASWACSRPCR